MRALKAITCAVAATGLVFGGVAQAQASRSVNMLPSTSVAKRAQAPVTDASELNGRGSGIIIGVLALAAFVGGLVILADGGDDKSDN